MTTPSTGLTLRPLGSPESRRARSGIAAIEMAVCLPVIILLVFGTIEASGLIFLKQALHVAAYEGVRETVRVDSNNSEGAAIAMSILSSRKIKDVQIRFPNGEASQAKRGDEVVIEVSVSKASNSPLLGHLGTKQTLTARVVMLKE
ncbi:MAG: pilus assembly protein [Rubripirellula sp.]|nr:pilus assembly protein [Rubripirellula sp.]